MLKNTNVSQFELIQELKFWLCPLNGFHSTVVVKPVGCECLQTQQISICHHYEAVAVNPRGFTGSPGVTNQPGLLYTRHRAINHKIILFTIALDLKLLSFTQTIELLDF